MDRRFVLFLACVAIAIASIEASSSASTESVEQGECLEGQNNVTVFKCEWIDACEDNNGNCTGLCESFEATATCLCSMDPRDYKTKKGKGKGHGWAKGHSTEEDDEILVLEPEDGCPDFDPCEDAESLCPDEKSYCKILYPAIWRGNGKSGESGSKSSSSSSAQAIEDGVYYSCEKCKKPADDKKSCGDKNNGRGGRRG